MSRQPAGPSVPPPAADGCPETATRVAAVVLNYRTPGLVIDGLPALARDLDAARDRIVIVDNASGDDSVERIREALRSSALPAQWRERIEIVEAERNGGFSAGNNLGVESVRAQAYLLLNSDTIVRQGCVSALLEALDRDPDVGVLSPRLEWPDGTPQISCFRFPTPASELLAGCHTGPVTRLLSRYDVPLPISDAPSYPEWTSFAAVLIRGEVFDVVGPMDDGFFMYFEDVDYCRRARRVGWKVMNLPSAHVVHLRGGTSPVKRLTAALERRPGYYYASRARYLTKAGGATGLLAANVLWSVGRAVAFARETLGAKPPHTVAHELRDIWCRA